MSLLKRIWKSIVGFVIGDEPAFLQQHCGGDPEGAFAPEEEEDEQPEPAKLRRPSGDEGRAIVLNALMAGATISEAATALACMGGPRTWNGFRRRMRNLREKDWEQAIHEREQQDNKGLLRHVMRGVGE